MRFFTLLGFLFIFKFSFSQSKSPASPKPELIATTTAVFIDNDDKNEYAVGMNITKGKLSQNQYVQAKGNTLSYQFVVKNIKVNELQVPQAMTGDNAFVIMQSNGKAQAFNEGWIITSSTEEAYKKVVKVTSQPVSEAKVNQTTWSFKINGEVANTSPKTKDNEEAIALHNMQNNQLIISLYGDLSSKPRRGDLTITIPNFTSKIGKYASNSLSFARYRDLAGNLTAQWQNAKPSSSSVKITRCEPGESTILGKTYYISGTCSDIALIPALGYAKDAQGNLQIGEVKFVQLLVQELYAKKK